MKNSNALAFESSDQKISRKLKILAFGGPKVGKTHFALTFPGVVAFDTESSTDAFRGRADLPKFLVAKTKETRAILDACESMAVTGKVGGQPVETVSIDSYSVLWHVRREAGEKAAEAKAIKYHRDPDKAKASFFDWGWVKRPIKRLDDLLVNLPFHVVLTAREKPIYDEVDGPQGKELKIVGYEPDVHRDTPYVFDIVMRLYTNEDGKRVGEIYGGRYAHRGFPEGTIIENPSYDSFKDLEIIGETMSHTPTDDEAALAEAADEPVAAAWTGEGKMVSAARKLIISNGLTEGEVSKALGCIWTKTAKERDEFRAFVVALGEYKAANGNTDGFEFSPVDDAQEGTDDASAAAAEE